MFYCKNKKLENMKVLYCSYSEIPSMYANSIAVMQQCSALSKEVEFRALLIKGKQGDVNVFEEYSVSEFSLYRMPKWCLKHNEIGLKIALLINVILWHPDVVYTRDILLNEWLCKFHIPNVYEIHQLDMEDEEFDVLFKQILLRVKENIYLKSIVSISETLKHECINWGVCGDKITVLHSGVSIHVSRALVREIHIPEFDKKRPLAIYVGSIQKGKGIDIILKMSGMSDKYNFLIIGGKKGDVMETENLKHIPRVKNELARAYMKKADFLLLPMTEQRYKFHSPLKLFEYLATGKPIIATANEDISEILQHKCNAMLAKEYSPVGFLRCMEEVHNSELLRIRLSENALKTAMEHTWEKRASAINKLLEDIYYEK